jgi:hypothetical protein
MHHLVEKQLWIHVLCTYHYHNMHFVVKYNGWFTIIAYVRNSKKLFVFQSRHLEEPNVLCLDKLHCNLDYFMCYVCSVQVDNVTALLSALLSNGSVNKPQQRDCFYVVRYATVAMQHRGKHISAAVSRHATIRTTWEVFCAVRANKQYNWVFCAVGAEVI